MALGAGLLNALIGQAVHEHGDALQRQTAGQVLDKVRFHVAQSQAARKDEQPYIEVLQQMWRLGKRKADPPGRAVRQSAYSSDGVLRRVFGRT